MSLPEQFSKALDRAELDPADKKHFLEEWDLTDGDLSDEQILLAIMTGHL